VSNRQYAIFGASFLVALALIWIMSGVDVSMRAPSGQSEVGNASPAATISGATPSPAARAESFDFSAPDLRGHMFSMMHWRGHPIVIDFWATWCGPCRRQVPELEKLLQKYSQSAGLVIVGVACDSVRDGTSGDIEGFVREFGISYPILVGNEELVDSLGVEAIPTTYFVDANGQVVDRIIGAGHPGELSREVEALLAHRGPAPAAPQTPSGGNGHVVDLGWFPPR